MFKIPSVRSSSLSLEIQKQLEMLMRSNRRPVGNDTITCSSLECPCVSNANLCVHVKGEIHHALCGSVLMVNDIHGGSNFLSVLSLDGATWVIIVFLLS